MGRKSREKKVRRETSSLRLIPKPQPTPEQLEKILKAAGLSAPPLDGVITLDPEITWQVDPWIWFPAADSFQEIYRRIGTDVPVATFLNRDYQVSLFEARPTGGWPDMWHLSIKRRDRQPLEVEPQGRWRTLQKIKNTLIGFEHEGLELFPAETRLVDTANQWHLFVLKDDRHRFPIGFHQRLVGGQGSHGAVQRPFDDSRPTQDAEIAAKMTEMFNSTEKL